MMPPHELDGLRGSRGRVPILLPKRRVVLPSPCCELLEISFWRSGGIPMPVSTISNMGCPGSALRLPRTVLLLLLPFGVKT